ncbi:unnamed protein product [Rotaria socialis]|uniref:VWFD domain-containing protein n=1 Tax=Rotaria socialis TaxID=392032 RepID=A0A821SU65_9BILA|nr:unnamed protein product [Rotaria socialis]CAF4861490.1 unnamed protein product [Rotaria socialis]
MAYQRNVDSACPVADDLERDWIENFPPGRNVTAQVYYDPHFVGFNNQNFDCHPPGEAVLFKNSMLKFEIDVNHKPVNQTVRPSVIDSFTFTVKSDKIQYQVDNGQFTVNGKVPKFINNWIFLSEAQTAIVMESGNKFHIYTGIGPRLTVYNCSCYNLNATLTLPRTHAENAEPSLFGNLKGEHGKIVQPTGSF